MSYQAQQIMATNEALLTEYGRDLQHLLDGDSEEAVVYKGPVSGLSHHSYRNCRHLLHVGDYLEVSPDPNNKYDSKATGLMYEGFRIGWVPKAMNRICANAAYLGVVLTARIIRHKEFTGDFTNILYVEVIATLTESDKDIVSSMKQQNQPEQQTMAKIYELKELVMGTEIDKMDEEQLMQSIKKISSEIKLLQDFPVKSNYVEKQIQQYAGAMDKLAARLDTFTT